MGAPVYTYKHYSENFEALIKMCLDYCSTVWGGLSVTLNDKLLKLQNRALRAINESPYSASSHERFSKLGLDDLSTCQKSITAILMFKTIHDLSPPYLHECLTFAAQDII